MTHPLVAIVVLNWNNPGDTIACLHSVQALDYPNGTTLVVDNGSTDDSVARIRSAFPDVTVVETGENLGYAEGNNVGLRAALTGGADLLLVLNNDVTVAPNMLSLLVQAMEMDPRIGMTGPAVYLADPPDRPFAIGSRILWRRAAIEHLTGVTKTERSRDPDFLVGCAVCVRRAVLETAGSLNPDYYLNFEDVEWCVRTKKSGWRIVSVPDARVWHKVSSSLGLASPLNTYYMTRNALLFFGRSAPGIWRVIAPFRVLVRTLRTVVAWTIKPQYHSDLFRRRRDANLLAVRDFLLRRYGRIGAQAI